MSQTHEQVILDITIAAPIETVWAALREPARIETWFGWDAPSLAEEIKIIFVDNVVADAGRHHLQFGEWEGMSHAIALSPEGELTGLRVLRAAVTPADWNAYDDITEGWINFIQQLRLALERHRAEARRTLYLSGPARQGIGAPATELGLGDIVGLAPDTAYAANLGTGDSITGQVWHQTHFQTGLTVAQWGDGLLVVSDMGVAPQRPHGGGSVLLTTYGLSDAEFAALEQRWRQWWSVRYSAPTQ